MADVVDYFTDDQFRTIIGDTHSPYKYEESDVERAQKEVIDRLERWSKTSWQSRERLDRSRSNVPLVTIKRVPIIDVASIVLNGVELDLSLVNIDPVAGIARWGDWSPGRPPKFAEGFVPVLVTYTYGFNEDVPAAVMRPCVQAAASLLDGEEGRSKIPRNTTKYSTERTDISMGRRGSVDPWPWDPRATDDIRAYWNPFRPRGWITSVA